MGDERQRAERIIAEWLGIKIYQGDMLTLTVADGCGHQWSPATDANLWFGADGLLFAMTRDVERFSLSKRFINQLDAEAAREGGPSSKWSCLFGGPLSWTYALAAAIEEVADG